MACSCAASVVLKIGSQVFLRHSIYTVYIAEFRSNLSTFIGMASDNPKLGSENNLAPVTGV